MGGRWQHGGPGNAGAATSLEITLEKRLISAGSASQPWRGCCESSSTTRRDTAGSKLGVQGHGCDPLHAAKISRLSQRAQTEADQRINPTFPSPELGLSWQSRSLPALQGHETAASTRAGGQVSLPWPVRMALGWESGDHAARGEGTSRYRYLPRGCARATRCLPEDRSACLA